MKLDEITRRLIAHVRWRGGEMNLLIHILKSYQNRNWALEGDLLEMISPVNHKFQRVITRRVQ